MGILENLRAKSARPDHVKVEDIDLRGTGLTKRIAERDTKAYEKEVAASLKAQEAPSLLVKGKFENALEQTIAALREENSRADIVLDESQFAALAGMLHNQCSILIGAAGTGKTTLEKMLIEALAKIVKVIDMRETKFVTIEGPDGKPMRVKESAKSGTVKQEMPSIATMAYTGRATQQMKRALPEIWHRTTTTIHAGLGYAPEFEEVEQWDTISRRMEIRTRRVFRPSFGEHAKLPYTVYIFDEASMIPIPLWNEFIAASNPTDRIVLIGDIHQLPPTHGKSVLGYAMRKWPVFELTHIHRQAAGNAIIMNAHRVLQGKPLENAENFHIIGTEGKTLAPGGGTDMKTYILKVVQQLHGLGRYDPYRDAIIVPQNKGMIGINELNPMLVTMFNPERKENGVVVNKRTHIHTGTEAVFFALGDKVMITSNINTVEPPITNGMIGVIESLNINGRYDMKRAQVNLSGDEDDFGLDEPLEIDMDSVMIDMAANDEAEDKKDDDSKDQRQASHVLTIKFESGQTYAASTAGDFRRIVHGYASTCHKSQGGEYPNVIIVCHSANAVMLSQEWLYTAITRARQNVYLIGNTKGINQALKRQMIKGHSLSEKIRSYIIETHSDDPMDVVDTNKFPILWDNKQIED